MGKNVDTQNYAFLTESGMLKITENFNSAKGARAYVETDIRFDNEFGGPGGNNPVIDGVDYTVYADSVYKGGNARDGVKVENPREEIPTIMALYDELVAKADK